MTTLKDRIIECLIEKRVTKAQLARATKSPRATISDWTSGKTKSLSGDKLILAAHYFGVSPTWLETGKGKKRPGSIEIKPPERLKIDAILDAADKAIVDVGAEFTTEQKIEIYYDAIEFALFREFPEDLIERYLKQIASERSP